MKRSINFWLCLILTLGLPSAVINAEQAPASFQQCIACHGDKAQGNATLNAPALAGQSESYLSRQLNNFSTGLRGAAQHDVFGSQMVAIAKQLSNDKDVPALAKYIAALPSVKNQQTTTGDLKNGSRYFQAKCGACHGGQAQGNEAFKAPKLSGLSNEYLIRQMTNFQTGIRGNHQDDKLGRQMAMMAKTVSDEQLTDILYYISQQ